MHHVALASVASDALKPCEESDAFSKGTKRSQREHLQRNVTAATSRSVGAGGLRSRDVRALGGADALGGYAEGSRSKGAAGRTARGAPRTLTFATVYLPWVKRNGSGAKRRTKREQNSSASFG